MRKSKSRSYSFVEPYPRMEKEDWGYDVGTYMEVDAKSSPALRGSGNTSSLSLFNGFDTREFVSRLYAIECCFEASDFSEHEKCDMAVLCLRNDALKWYNSITFANRKNGKIIFKYWHKLRCCLKEKYHNKTVMSDLKIELENLKMDSFCVKDYAMRFKELYFICGSPKDSSEKINLFYIGLNSEIQGWIDIEQISSFELLCKLSLYSENLIHEHEVYIKSLAKTDAKHAVFVGHSNGLDCELPLTHGVTLGDNGVNIGNVMVQKVVKDTKLGYKPYPCGMGLLSVGLEGFNTNGNICFDSADPLVEVLFIPIESSMKGSTLGDDLQLAYAQLVHLNYEFLWEHSDLEENTKLMEISFQQPAVVSCPKSTQVVPMVLRKSRKKAERGGADLKRQPVSKKRLRYFFLIFDPGGEMSQGSINTEGIRTKKFLFQNC